MTVRLVRPALALALGAVAVAGLPALAADAPKTSTTSSTFFLVQDGCGAEMGPGRLEVKKLESDSPGCGVVGGLPLNEALHQVEGVEPDSFDTVGKGLPITLDATKKVTGQVSALSWFAGLVPTGGAGEVEFDVAATARTSAGGTVDFGSTTVSAMGFPGQDVVQVPFELTPPATANGAKITSLSLLVSLRGANAGYSAYAFGGESYVVVPTKVVKPAPKKK